MFPRLFSLLKQKECCVRECGFWDGLQWIWNFQWRRNLFQWELEMLEEMNQALAGVHLNSFANDRVIWKLDIEKEFSVKSITNKIWEKRVHSEAVNAFNFTKSICKGLFAPES